MKQKEIDKLIIDNETWRKMGLREKLENINPDQLAKLYEFLTNWRLNGLENYSRQDAKKLINQKKYKKRQLRSFKDIDLRILENSRLQFDGKFWNYIVGQSYNEEMISLMEYNNNSWTGFNTYSLLLSTMSEMQSLYKKDLKMIKDNIYHDYIDFNKLPLHLIDCLYCPAQLKFYPTLYDLEEFIEHNLEKIYLWELKITPFTIEISKVPSKNSLVNAHDHNLDEIFWSKDLNKVIIDGYPYLINDQDRLFDLSHRNFDYMEIGETIKLKALDRKLTEDLLQDLDNGY
jgi:hypothetical protein